MNIPKYTAEFRKELTLLNYAETSIKTYESILKLFLSAFDQTYSEPKKISEAVIKDYLLQCSSVSLLKQNIGCLKLFYKIVIRQPLKFSHIKYPKKAKTFPIILEQSEVHALIKASEQNKKHHAILCLMYATGVRISELLDIKLSDIDRKLLCINIMNGKGAKQRQVPINDWLIDLLGCYWKEYKTKVFLFEGQFGGKYSSRSVCQFIKKYAIMAKINKEVYPHLIRHCSFSHSLDQGNDIYHIQKVAGHNRISTTSIYLHLSPAWMREYKIPMAKWNNYR